MPPSAIAIAHSPSAGGALSIREIRRAFGPVHALKGVSLEIPAGEFFSLLGPSGCGKTTLLRILAGLDHPDSGCLSLDGRDLLPIPAHQRPLNTVFQTYALFPHLNARDNIAFGLRMKKTPPPEIDRRVRAIMDLVDIAPLAARKPHELSGGQRQRVALARALVNEPRVLLLDEPLAAVDQKLRHQLQNELLGLQRRLGLTFIYVTHDQEEALRLSDRLAVMDHGEIAQVGPPQEIYSRPHSRFVAQFLGHCNLLEGESISDGLVKTALGEIRVPAGAKPGPATLAFRPERVVLGPGENQIHGVIEETIFTGPQVHLSIKCGPVTLRAASLSHRDSQLPPGAPVTISIPSNAISILDR